MSMSIDFMMRVHIKAQLRKLCRNKGGAVSAGALAKQMHISRGTAKKYLDALAGQGEILPMDVLHVNNQKATLYYAGEK